jgi:hypothetical protein
MKKEDEPVAHCARVTGEADVDLDASTAAVRCRQLESSEGRGAEKDERKQRTVAGEREGAEEGGRASKRENW